MTDEQNERAARVWREACDAYAEGAATDTSLPMRDMVIAGDQAAAAVIAADRAGLVAENARLREALKQAEAVFTHYGELHAAKPDPVKARRNFDLADAMRAALKDTCHDT